MAQYKTDFSEYTTGVAPSDWTWVSSDVNSAAIIEDYPERLGGKVLKLTKANNTNHNLIKWDAIDGDANRDEVETLSLHKLSTQTYQHVGGAYVRGSGVLDTENCYIFNRHGPWRVTVLKLINGSETELSRALVPASQYYNQKEYLWVRGRVSGSTISYKAWQIELREPDDWEFVITDTDISGVGDVGFNIYDGLRDPAYLQFFSVGTNGDVAPMPDDDQLMVIRSSSMAAEALVVGAPPVIRASSAHVEALFRRPGQAIRASSAHVEVMFQTPPVVAGSGNRRNVFIVT
jgi:hypothetical protein